MGIVVGNLIVLAKFFLMPRMQFFPVQPGLRKQLMEITGPRDMPNQLWQTYRVVNRIQEMTPKNATVFMPPGDRLQGSFRSVTTQILYPRKLFFGGSENFESELKKANHTEAVYFVYSPDWRPDYCEELYPIEMTDSGFGMCRLDS